MRLLIDLFFVLVSITDNEFVGNLNGFQEQMIIHIDVTLFDDYNYHMSKFGKVDVVKVLTFIESILIDYFLQVADLDIYIQFFITNKNSFQEGLTSNLLAFSKHVQKSVYRMHNKFLFIFLADVAQSRLQHFSQAIKTN